MYRKLTHMTRNILILFTFLLSYLNTKAFNSLRTEFSNSEISQNVVFNNITSKVRPIIPKIGEISRWEITLKKMVDSFESDAKVKLAIQELSINTDFMSWWSQRKDGMPNQKSLAVFEIKKESQNSINIEIAFLTFLEQARGVVATDGGAAAIVFYNVNVSRPITLVNVENSSVPLVVWSAESLYSMKFKGEYGFERAKSIQGGLIPIDEVNPYSMRFIYGIDSKQK